MLEDKFGRRFHYLRLSITDVCNFSCTYCLPDGYACDSDRDFMSVAEISTLVSTFAKLGTSKVRITGGEPSLRKDLPEIIRQCASTPGIEHVALTSNGYKLEKCVEEWAEAGLDSINISIDSLDPRLFAAITGHDSLDTILRGIDKALLLGLKVKVNAVLMRQYNEAEFASFLNWVKSTPISLRLIELMQTGDNVTFFQKNHVSAEPLKNQLLQSGWGQVIRDKAAGPAQEFYHPDYAGKIGLIMPYSKDFCHSCNRLRISATGKLHLCLFAEEGLNIRRYITAGDEQGLQQELVALLGDKEASHWLQDGLTGATKHLAMLGG
ncbi:MAG: GTP 3',8-cyclase MoaA [Paraglaciecola sp.]|uniref:GTP 3',8-cyclase MoaA n=1 Tax=Pseudomonadati TaxID=3379134 RepID=UPI00273E9D31|nr:GTP 3',8-cyclase MoaA [Paraglaciecola sp.]MDP5029364.1 GTP 3',8-cyclase MoaA [Paraglaciecola sp.]MDP5041478.1 GTP 3',8-cyclase MoaA [Paraglaciecola sp.]MDP5132322.1 GTP 3',8-cyclase MoaA [Paraglaciecola sp.]